MFVNKLVKDRIMWDNNSGGMDTSLHLVSVLALHHTHTKVYHVHVMRLCILVIFCMTLLHRKTDKFHGRLIFEDKFRGGGERKIKMLVDAQ